MIHVCAFHATHSSSVHSGHTPHERTRRSTGSAFPRKSSMQQRYMCCFIANVSVAGVQSNCQSAPRLDCSSLPDPTKNTTPSQRQRISTSTDCLRRHSLRATVSAAVLLLHATIVALAVAHDKSSPELQRALPRHFLDRCLRQRRWRKMPDPLE